MADFCVQCAEELDLPRTDFKYDRGKPLPEGMGWVELCEGCGVTLTDNDGRCLGGCLTPSHTANEGSMKLKNGSTIYWHESDPVHTVFFGSGFDLFAWPDDDDEEYEPYPETEVDPDDGGEVPPTLPVWPEQPLYAGMSMGGWPAIFPTATCKKCGATYIDTGSGFHDKCGPTGFVKCPNTHEPGVKHCILCKTSPGFVEEIA